MDRKFNTGGYLLSENPDKTVYKITRSQSEAWGGGAGTTPFKLKDKGKDVTLSLDTIDSQSVVIKMKYEEASALYELLKFYVSCNGFDDLYSCESFSNPAADIKEKQNFYNPYPDCEEFIGAPGSPDMETVRVNYILTT